MASAQEFIKLLYSNDEPLCKKIKIADTAFKSNLLFQHREALLIKWLMTHIKKENNESWEVFNAWIKSEQFKALTRNDISIEDIDNILEIITLKFNNESINKPNLINSSILLFESQCFQQYFKSNLSVYCTFLSNIIENIDNEEDFINVLKNQSLFKNVTEEKFYKLFLKSLAVTLADKQTTFNSEDTFLQLSKLFQKCLINRSNLKDLETFLNKFFTDVEETKLPFSKAILKYLLKNYNSPTFKITFKVLSNALNFEDTYKLFIICTQLIGFDTTVIQHNLDQLKKENSLANSLNILLSLFEALLICPKLDCTLKNQELSLTDFIQNLLKSIMAISKPNTTIFKIFLITIKMNPLIIETLVQPITVYLALSDCSEDDLYELVMIEVFQVFAKLHRLQNFIAKLIPTLKTALEGENFIENPYKFQNVQFIKTDKKSSYKMFPKRVIEYFGSCVWSLASWQVINLFKTVLFHLNKAIDELETVEENLEQVVFMEVLGSFMCCLLMNAKIADHNLPVPVIEKFKVVLEELKEVLGKFGLALLKREHKLKMVRIFLNLSFFWGEARIMMMNYLPEVESLKGYEGDYSACNLTYLHTYLNVKQWCLLSERITNFGEAPCKQLMLKLFIQKLKAMHLFDQNINKLYLDVLNTIITHKENCWKMLLSDEYFISELLPKMETSFLIYLAENIVKESTNESELKIENKSILTAINYYALNKIKKALKQKKLLYNKVNVFNQDDFFDGSEVGAKIHQMKPSFNEIRSGDSFNEDKVMMYLRILKQFPVIFTTDSAEKILFLCVLALHTDSVSCKASIEFKQECESIIFGILQHNNIRVFETIDLENVTRIVISNFNRFEEIFALIAERVFKNKEAISRFEPSLKYLLANIEEVKARKCCFIVYNIINKYKKSKHTAETKNKMLEYNTKIITKVTTLIELLEPNKNLIESYSYVMKNSISKNEMDKISDKLEHYVTLAFNSVQDEPKSCFQLFSTILYNKTKFEIVNDDFIARIWSSWATWSKIDEFPQIAALLLESISNDLFKDFIKEVFKGTDEVDLKICHAIVGSSFNQVKIKHLQNSLEDFLATIVESIDTLNIESYVQFFTVIIQNHQLMLTPPMIDLFLLSVSRIMVKDFKVNFKISINLLECMLKHRKPMIMDRLPAFLQQYRLLLIELCRESDAQRNLSEIEVQELANCAHLLEKLTNSLTSCQKDMSRIAMYLVADILHQYEQITLYPTVKVHLTNCIYSLMNLFDQHSISFLLRVLSTASTEMFKLIYDSYKKFYRFTGKV